MAKVIVEIGGEKREFANQGEALQAMADYANQLQQKLQEKQAETAEARPFTVEMARYSEKHEKTEPLLRGKLKGSIKIVSEKIPFGIDIMPDHWFELQDHAADITKFIEENRQVLKDALKFATDTKKAVKAGKVPTLPTSGNVAPTPLPTVVK